MDMLHPIYSEVNTIISSNQQLQYVWTFHVWKIWIFGEQVLQIKHAIKSSDRSLM